MDTEQLKLILDTFSALGENGKSAFIWWLVLDKVLPVFAWLTVFSGLFVICLKLLDGLNNITKFEELRNALGVGTSGPMTAYETTETLKRAIALANKNV